MLDCQASRMPAGKGEGGPPTRPSGPRPAVRGCHHWAPASCGHLPAPWARRAACVLGLRRHVWAAGPGFARVRSWCRVRGCAVRAAEAGAPGHRGPLQIQRLAVRAGGARGARWFLGAGCQEGVCLAQSGLGGRGRLVGRAGGGTTSAAHLFVPSPGERARGCPSPGAA